MMQERVRLVCDGEKCNGHRCVEQSKDGLFCSVELWVRVKPSDYFTPALWMERIRKAASRNSWQFRIDTLSDGFQTVCPCCQGGICKTKVDRSPRVGKGKTK